MTINLPSISSWKSTVSGLLTVSLSTTAALLAYPPLQTHLKFIAILGGVQVVLKLWVAIVTTDADKITSTDVAKANLAAQAKGK